MKGLLLIMATGLILSSFSCEPEIDGWHSRKLYPYNPKKAGAVIEKHFDITDSIIFPDRFNSSSWVEWVTDIYNKRITASYDIAEYNGNFYIHINGKIFIYDKETFQLAEDIITINFPTSNYSEDDYNELIHKNEPFYDPYFLRFYRMGMVITGNKALLLITSNLYPYLFSVDLSTGNAILLDEDDTLGLRSIRFAPAIAPIMGYNKANNRIWFYDRFSFIFFNYDEDTHIFTAQETKIAAYNVGKHNNCIHWWASMNDNVVWYNCFFNDGPSDNLRDIGLDRRSLDNPSRSLQYIDVQHLGTRSIPQSIIYDPPYIWIIVERDDQIQMLKLLPNG